MAIVTVAEAQSYARIASGVDDDLIATLISAVQDWVEHYLGQPAESSSFTEYLDGGSLYLYPGWAHITAVAEVYDMVDGDMEDADDYDFYPDGIFRVSGGKGPSSEWPAGGRRWRVNYTAVSPKPDLIKAAVLMLVKRWYDMRAGEKSQSALGLSTNWGELASGEIAQMLDSIKTPVL